MTRSTAGRSHCNDELAGAVDGVIGVDTHRDTLAAAATDTVGGLLAQTSVRADAAGYRHLYDFA
jgi:transposase